MNIPEISKVLHDYSTVLWSKSHQYKDNQLYKIASQIDMIAIKLDEEFELQFTQTWDSADENE